MQTVTNMPDFDRMYQRFFPAPVAPVLSAAPHPITATPQPVLANTPAQTNYSTATLIICAVIGGLLIYTAACLYKDYQQRKSAENNH